jgi:hypothetical protein
MQRFLIDQTENRSDQEKKELYKDFKKQLTLTSLDQLVTMTNKAFDKDYPPYQEIAKDPLKINAIESLKKYSQKALNKGDEQAEAIIQKLSTPILQMIGITNSKKFQTRIETKRGSDSFIKSRS